QPGVRDVDPGGEHRHADRVDLDELRAVEGKHDVQVVDHEVEDDVDVQAAGGKRPQPVDLDEAGFATGRPKDLGGGVEAFDVSDLEDGTRLLGESNELVSLAQRGRHRLLDQ